MASHPQEFHKERAWKAQQARKWARAVAKSELDVESRAARRAKEARRGSGKKRRKQGEMGETDGLRSRL